MDAVAECARLAARFNVVYQLLQQANDFCSLPLDYLAFD